jgi:hypothetical protein
MFSFLLEKAGLNDVFAPRSTLFRKELFSLLHAELYAETLVLIRKEVKEEKKRRKMSDNDFVKVINELDERNGMAPVHFACAAGEMVSYMMYKRLFVLRLLT